MPCQDCFNNCTEIYSDQCIKYTGPDSSILGIKSGDSLYCVENSLIDYISTLIDGTGISIEITSACTLLTNLLNTNTDLKAILQAFSDAICAVQSSIDDLQPVSVSYDTSCLSGLPLNPTTEDIVKALVTKICTLSTDVATIKADYVKSSELTERVQTIISQNSQSTTIQEYTKMPKYVALPYHGSLSNFDSNGKGISTAGYDQVYLCIGQTVNGFILPDYRGRSPLGVNVNIPGGAMDTAVDPAQIINAGYGITLGVKKGSFTHTLTVQETAPHTHSITDPGHTHWTTVKSRDLKNSNDFGSDHTNDGADSRSFQTDSAKTGISIQSSGGGQPHNNLSPSIGALFIMYIPS